MDDVTGGKPFTQARDDALAHQPLHLERHARQRDHHLGVWRAGNIEPHARGGAEGVVEHRAAAGHPRLLPVDVGELAAEGSHALPHIVEGLFVLVQLAVEKVAKHLFGEVVLGGTKPAGDDHNVADFQAVAEGVADGGRFVADGDSAFDADAGGAQHFSHHRCIGVDNLSDEELVADVDEGAVHSS